MEIRKAVMMELREVLTGTILLVGQEEGKRLILEALDDVLEAGKGGPVCPT